MASVHQELGGSLAACFWLRVCRSYSICSYLKVDPLWQAWHFHAGSHTWLTSWSLVPLHGNISTGLWECLHGIMWAFPTVGSLREQGKNCSAFCALCWKAHTVTCIVVYWPHQPWFNVRQDCIRPSGPGAEHPCKSSCRLAPSAGHRLRQKKDWISQHPLMLGVAMWPHFGPWEVSWGRVPTLWNLSSEGGGVLSCKPHGWSWISLLGLWSRKCVWKILEDQLESARLGDHRAAENALGGLDGERRNELRLHVSHCYLGLVLHTSKHDLQKYWQAAHLL